MSALRTTVVRGCKLNGHPDGEGEGTARTTHQPVTEPKTRKRKRIKRCIMIVGIDK
jgi:hypothetical protein